MRKLLLGMAAAVLAGYFCCAGLSAQEPDEPVAAGSVFEIGKAEVGLEEDFTVKPKVQATYTHPVTKKAGLKATAKVVNKIGPKDPADTADCEWTKRIPLYDKKLLSVANKAGTFTATWLAETPDQNQPLPLPLSLTSKQVPVNALDRTIHLSPPLIYDVEVGEAFITITGRWFGTKKPKVWMEYLNAKDQVKRLMCKVGAPDGEDGRVNVKDKPVYMNPVDGASKVVVQVPKLPKGVAWEDLSHVVLDSGAGLAADTKLYLITGTVSGAIAASVTVTLTGDAAMTTTTGIGGDYSFGVPAGSYTVTPSQDGYLFTPSIRDVTITDADSLGNDFASQGGGDGTYLVVDLVTGATANLTLPPPDMLTSTEYKTGKMVFRRIPAGGFFTMGSPGDEEGRYSNEPQHHVTLTQDFYIGVFEVTQSQYLTVMGTWPSWFNNPTYRDTRPVEQVSWDDIRGGAWPSDDPGADTFMDKLRTLAGAGYRFDLPTEAQWEYACRAGTTTALNSGKNLTETGQCPNMAEVGRYWYNGGSGHTQDGELSVGSAAVGSYLANAWGLYDMHGNVWEWCLDWYVADLGVDPVVDPVGGDTGSHRVVRGGGWGYTARQCRSANRYPDPPSYIDLVIGFRVSLAPPVQ